MNRYEVFNNCKARIKSKLKVHWHWLKWRSHEEVFEMIEKWMNQATNDIDNKLKENKYDGRAEIEENEISLCSKCGCMTKTILGLCGKCKGVKDE